MTDDRVRASIDDDHRAGFHDDDPYPECAMCACDHDWQEQPGEPPVDVCWKCGDTRY